jgi:phosphoglycolate phosphatase
MSTDRLVRRLRASGPVRIIYTDLDGTLLGPGGSLLTGPGGTPSARAATALCDAAAAAITVVPVSGRRREQLVENCRLMGLRDCIAETGGVVVRDGRVFYKWGQCPRGVAATPHDTLTVSGAVAALLSAFAGDLRHYEPWHRGREGGHLFHGRVDVGAANAVLSQAGCAWAYLVDNGATGGWEGRDVQAYHLLPRGVGKATAVADDLAARGLDAHDAIAVGDSQEDLTMAASVGTFVMVGNGEPTPRDDIVRVAGRMGDGFADAVVAALESRLN